jgi:CheY-like chemotaxis protein
MRNSKVLEALFPEARHAVLSVAFLEPSRWWDQAMLAERAGLQPWDLECELERLVAAEILVCRGNGSDREVRANAECPFFAEIHSIVAKAAHEAPNHCAAILVVEDEPATLKIARILLESWGYQVLLASSAPEALELFERHKDTIRVVLTDVVMPEMNGVQLAESLVALDGDVRIVFMSGYHGEGLKQVGRWPLTFLSKPFSPERLARTIREAMQIS